MQERQRDRARYFRELASTSERYFIPYLSDFMRIESGMNVLEIGCGEGGNLLPFARIGCNVTGVDLAANKIANAEFFVGKAEEVLPEKYEKEGIQADVIVVDPPRKGCDGAVLQTMLKMQPEKIVYVSCDSATLARDLKLLCENAYQLEKVAVCDMFPQGVHVETVCLLKRR